MTKVQLCGINSNECGYCHSEDPQGSVSYGVLAISVKVTDYESLMLEGWRRAGTYCYKPAMEKTCCPAYAIRLNVKNFKPTKSQKKVLRRFDRHATSKLKGEDGKEKKEVGDASNITIDMQCTTEPSSYSEEKFQLYKKYQIAVHNDKEEEVTAAGFTRFLVETPLVDDTKDKIGGSFHQLYRLNGKLIAVGVVDIVPSGLSSVYCFYDPDCRDLVLGKYVALKEIEYCQQHGLEYYYMGYYIHSCEKMRYKGEYTPSELRCPTTHDWVPLTDCIPYLERFKFTPLKAEKLNEREAIEAIYSTKDSKSDLKNKQKELQTLLYTHTTLPPLSDVRLDIGGQIVKLSQLEPKSQEIVRELLSEWMANAGPLVAKSAVIDF